ncbi:MAG: mechanosensitive ion channel, partial [Candidatus Latescibacteria bacterium]|nr:mechanosensitive ion channel [Candidatus Latescibacterota bacterium]
MIHFIQNRLEEIGVNSTLAETLDFGIKIIIIIIFCIIANYIGKKLILRYLTRLIARTETKWDDIILKRKVFHQLSHLAPGLVIYLLAPYILQGNERWYAFITDAVFIYMIVVGILVINSLLDAVIDIYRTFKVAKEIPIKGFIQVTKIFFIFIGGIFILSNIIDRSPLYIFSGLGALTAVLLLIFKDSILGLVAGIQLISNKMLAPGDWIEMPKFDADGDVIDITLTTVKVRNWDKTISTIPAYALISDSFKNWRGMSESGGRRIKRAVNIDINSIKFCDEKMLDRYSRIKYISEYIEKKRKEIADHNATLEIDDTFLVNG